MPLRGLHHYHAQTGSMQFSQSLLAAVLPVPALAGAERMRRLAIVHVSYGIPTPCLSRGREKYRSPSAQR